jgi:hypothetical protein
MRFTLVTVTRDETSSMPIHVGAWEIPVLEAKHGEERISVGDEVDFPDRPWPEDARSEMQRLSQLYGMTGAGDDALSFAERAYGAGSTGIKALEKAMKAARKGTGNTEDLVGSKAAAAG